jgi:hypothetical protein
MARFRMTRAFHFGGTRVSGGMVIADSGANAVSGDFIWTGLNSVTVPFGAIPLDGSATTMFNASRWAGTLPPATISGVDSISA